MTGTFLEEVKKEGIDFIDTLVGLLEKKGSNTRINLDEIPKDDRLYARLIDNTYKGNKNNVDKFIYDKSFNLPDITVFPTSLGYQVYNLLENIVPPQLQQRLRTQVSQTGVIRPSLESLDNLPFVGNLIRYFRNELDNGRYLFTDDNNLIQVREQARFVGSRLTAGADRLLPVRQIGQTIRSTRGQNVAIRSFQVQRANDRRTFSIREEDILQEGINLFYKPEIPTGIVGILPTALGLGYALHNLEGSEDENIYKDFLMRPIPPRIHKYNVRDSEDTLFTIRGTADMSDLLQDVLEGATELSKNIGLSNQLLDKKIDTYEKFIMENKNPGKVILAGHSLGALEVSHLVERLTQKGIDVEAVGFAQPVLAPHKKVNRSYSFSRDPLFRENDSTNHLVIEKTVKSTDRFKDYHSIENYF